MFSPKEFPLKKSNIPILLAFSPWISKTEITPSIVLTYNPFLLSANNISPGYALFNRSSLNNSLEVLANAINTYLKEAKWKIVKKHGLFLNVFYLFYL